MPRCYDRASRPITSEEWARRQAFDAHVALVTLPDGTRVSTVWLGLDHRFGYGPPLIFETMVFAPDGGGGGGAARPPPAGGAVDDEQTVATEPESPAVRRPKRDIQLDD